MTELRKTVSLKIAFISAGIDHLEPSIHLLLFGDIFVLYISCMTYDQFLLDALRTPASNLLLRITHGGG